jgi:hypothetical protein
MHIAEVPSSLSMFVVHLSRHFLLLLLLLLLLRQVHLLPRGQLLSHLPTGRGGEEHRRII